MADWVKLTTEVVVVVAAKEDGIFSKVDEIQYFIVVKECVTAIEELRIWV